MYFHSVTLDKAKCKGCTNCIKKCPTEAIRVTNGKARIIKERCIDCGLCIKVCPHHAKKAITDDFSLIETFKYKIALPAPSMYAQFKQKYSRKQIIAALMDCGFDSVYEVALAAQYVTHQTKLMLDDPNIPKPIISTACPAVVRLIQLRFPSLIDNLLNMMQPMEVAALNARKEAVEKTGYSPEDIGVFFITPCAAKMTAVKSPYGMETSNVSGVFSVSDIYLKVLDRLDSADENSVNFLASGDGIKWCGAGGESGTLYTDNFLAVDGIQSVISVLEEIENETIQGIDFLEALACTGGCLGGPLNVENVYVAKTSIKKHIAEAKAEVKLESFDNLFDNLPDIRLTEEISVMPFLRLDDDMSVALQKMEKIDELEATLPGLDCGACGAPTCRAFAEDIVQGLSRMDDCIVIMKDEIKKLRPDRG